MIDETELSYEFYLTNGATTQFDTPFKFWATTDLVVTLQEIATLDETTLTIADGEISVTGGNGEVGSVTTTATYATGYKLLIDRQTTKDQTVDLTATGDFDAEAVESQLDKGIAIAQEQGVVEDLTLKGNLFDIDTVDFTLPTASARKGLVWDSDGTGLENTTYDPDEQVATAIAQAVIATTQAGIATTKAGAASDSADEAAVSAGTINLPSISGASEDDILTVNSAIDGYDFTSKASQAEAEAGTDANKYMTPLRTAQAISALGGFDYIKVSDTKSDGTNAGSFTSGSYLTRDITTEDSDVGGHCSISSNQITLVAGTYITHIFAPASAVDAHKIKLYNVTDSSDTLIGCGAMAASTIASISHSCLNGTFTITATKTFEIQHRCSTTNGSADGRGLACNYGDVEVYTIAEFWKTA